MRIIMCGAGTVGGGVCEMLSKYENIHISHLFVRDISKARDFALPMGCILTSRLDDIIEVIEDKGTDAVVELIGGTDKAWEIIQACVRRGVHVVSGNKALISKHLVGLEKMIKSHSKPPFFLYEAAVCGGIPIINTLLRGMKGDVINSIFGVVNGSTNWMLDRMDRDGCTYDSLVSEAKALGYLEADPSADIEGWDSRSKLCILSRLSFGIALNENEVPCVGISAVTQKDVSLARSHGRRIKLLARSWVNDGVVHAFVFPAMVPQDLTVANLPGATNCISYQARFSGNHSMIGSGAGRFPTANSVVADILEIYGCMQRGCERAPDAFVECSGSPSFNADFTSRFYVRVSGNRERLITGLQQRGITNAFEDESSVITEECSYATLCKVLDSVAYDAIMVFM